MTETDQKRLFVAAPISLEAVAALTTGAETMKRAAAGAEVALRWVPPANYHLTLRYLGWSRPEAVHALRDVLTELAAGFAPIPVSLRGVGAFPAAKKARVLWAGIAEEGGALAKLAAQVDAACTELGWPGQEKAYHPHVTLARTKEVANVEPVLLPLSEQEFSKFRIGEIVLYESVMKSGGSEYLPVARFSLESGSMRPQRQSEPVEPGPSHDFEAQDSGLPDSAYDEDGTPPENYEER